MWRYVSAKHREESNMNLITEDHVQEIRNDICTLKYDVYQILEMCGSRNHLENKSSESTFTT